MGYARWSHRYLSAKRHWAKSETHTMCGRVHEDAPDDEELFGGSGRDLYALAETKDDVSCDNCLKKMPTRYERLAG